MKLYFCTPIKASCQKIRAGFHRELFLFLAPPWVTVNLKRFDGCSKNDEIHLELGPGPKQNWVSVITEHGETEHDWFFVDEGKVLPWPLKHWHHLHKVVSLGENQSAIIDDITFNCHYPWMNAFVYPLLWATFAIRPPRYRQFFED